MIETLHIRNIGIIDELSVDLNKGFNVLTGETGAGKTLIIDSLDILAGGRFSKEMIKHGTEYSFVEMSMLGDNGENDIISREINLKGKNLCKINGRMVTVSELKDFMKLRLDIHGQHDNQSLLETNMHINLLDEFAKQDLEEDKKEYQRLFEDYNNIKIELSKNYGDDKERQRKLDLLRYQENEIETAKLKNGEEEELENKRKIMLNSEKIVENLSDASIKMDDVVLDAVSDVIRNLEKIEALDEKYKEVLENLKNSYYDIQEVARDLSNLKDDVDFSESEREEIEQRLDIIFSLKRKYGNDIEEIIKYKEEISKEIYEIENLEEYTNKLKKDLSTIENKMENLAYKMNLSRTKNAKQLEEKINEELIQLEMKNAKLKVSIQYSKNKEFTRNGLDKVEFMIITNIGEEYKPLSKIASGGEMSRIMLAIKSVLAEVDKVETVVFDEIDTGISGIAANKVAEKIRKISKHHQVLCVTHLASIAAKGDYNYFVSKETIEDTTKTNIKLLCLEEKVNEIARIATGTITDISLKHAMELINR